MKGEINKPGQPYRQEDLDNLLGALETGSREREHDAFKYGVIAGSQMNGETGPFEVTVAGDLQHINVGSGLGYGPYDDSDADADWPIAGLTMEPPIYGGRTVTAGERIAITVADLATDYSRSSGGTGTGAYNRSPDGLGGYVDTPQSSGTQNIPLPTANDGTFYVWLAYLNSVDNTLYTTHKYSNGRLYYKKLDGYDIMISEGLNRPDSDPRFFAIASFEVSGGNIVGASVDQSMMPYYKTRLQRVGIKLDSAAIPATYADGGEYFLDDHVNCLGGGTASPDNPHAVAFPNIDGQLTSDQISVTVLGYGLTGASGADVSVQPDTTSSGATHAKAIYADEYGVGVVVDNVSIGETGGGIGVKAGGINGSMLASGAVTNDKLATDAVDTDNLLDASVTKAKIDVAGFAGTGVGFCPVGSIVMFGGTVAPDGWLLCDGSLYDDTTYAALKAVIGTIYGFGSGTFKVPDLRTRVPLGTALTYALGSTGGEATHTLTEAELAPHDHDLGLYGPAPSSHGLIGSPNIMYNTIVGSTYPAGGGAAHNNIQPYLTLNFIIKY